MGVVVSHECGDFNAPTNKLRRWTGDPKYVQGLNDTTIIILVSLPPPSVNTKRTSSRAENRFDSLKTRGLSCEWKKKKKIDDDPDRSIYNRVSGPVERWHRNFIFHNALCTFDAWSPRRHTPIRWKTSKTIINYTTSGFGGLLKTVCAKFTAQRGSRFDQLFQDGSTVPIIRVPTARVIYAAA